MSNNCNAQITPFTPQDFKVIKEETLFKGFYQVNAYEINFKCFDNTMSKTVRRELFVRRDAACILPFNPKTQMVVLLQQFRVGAMLKAENPWLVEMIAGIMDEEDKDPLDTAIRESKEEANIEYYQTHKMCAYYPSPGGSNEKLHCYLGLFEGDYSEGIHGLPSEGENIRAFPCSLSQALKWLEEGKIDNASTVISLMWLEKHLHQFCS